MDIRRGGAMQSEVTPRHTFGRVSGTWKVGRSDLSLMRTSGRVKGRILAPAIQVKAQVKAAALGTRGGEARQVSKAAAKLEEKIAGLRECWMQGCKRSSRFKKRKQKQDL